MKIKKRQSLTLLEVMIALSLAAVILSSLMTFYHQVSKKRIAAQELKRTILPIELMRQRLIHLFAGAAAAEMPSFKTGNHPSAVGEVLLFSYDNGVDLNPLFCGDVKGMLYVNPRHQLCLVSWAPNGEARQEIFLENVGQFSFSFFDAEDARWKHEWKKGPPFPPFFKISWAYVKQPKEMLECAFFFTQPDAKITYETQVPML